MSDTAGIARLQQILGNLQNQVSLVASMANTLSQSSIVPEPVHIDSSKLNSQAELSDYVKSLVRAEMARTGDYIDITPHPVLAITAPESTPEPIRTPEPTPEPVLSVAIAEAPRASLWDAIRPVMGAAFSRDQQLWLSQPVNLMGLPGFLMTPEGKAHLTTTLEAYQQFMGV